MKVECPHCQTEVSFYPDTGNAQVCESCSYEFIVEKMDGDWIACCPDCGFSYCDCNDAYCDRCFNFIEDCVCCENWIQAEDN